MHCHEKARSLHRDDRGVRSQGLHPVSLTGILAKVQMFSNDQQQSTKDHMALILIFILFTQ